MKITVLVENTSPCGLECEHGLSLFIKTKNHTILFDTGQSALFSENAVSLGADLSEVDLCVLSHGHYDHGGGLSRFLSINDKAPVYMSRYAFEPHYNGEKYIGPDESLKFSERIIFTDGVTRIDDGIILYSCHEKEKRFDLGSFGLMTEKDGKKVPDDFRHEHYLLIEEEGRRVLFSGCSHRGVLDIERWFAPDVLIGGFHFSKLPCDDTLKGYAEYLASFDTDYYTCHCTGKEQYEYMKRFLLRLSYLGTGESVIL